MGSNSLRVVKNASWIIIAKIIEAVIGVVINMFTARYLGSSNYGIISYASSVASFVLPIMQLGFPNVLVQELTNHPENEGKLIGTATTFSLITSLFCIGGVVSFAAIANAGEKETIIVCLLYSIMLIFQAIELVQYWFQSKLLSKYTSIASIIAYIVVALYKIYLLVSAKSIYWFAVINSLDFMLIAFMLLYFYKKLGGAKLQFSFAVGKDMFSRSKHYIVSSLMVTIFAQTDRIMIKLMIDDSSTGCYSAAVTCASMTGFVFVAIIDSMRPVIFESKLKSNAEYEKNIERLYCIVIYLALAQCIVMTVFSKLIIGILYGEDYSSSVGALRIVVWYTTFAYIGSIRNIWILGEQKQKYLWIINLSGALCNVILNYFLIPLLGINGAAIASLITQIFTNVIISFVIRPISRNNLLILKGLNPNLVLDYLRSKKGV